MLREYLFGGHSAAPEDEEDYTPGFSDSQLAATQQDHQAPSPSQLAASSNAPRPPPWLRLIPQYVPTEANHMDPHFVELPLVEVSTEQAEWGCGRMQPTTNRQTTRPWANSLVISSSLVSNWHVKFGLVGTSVSAGRGGPLEGSMLPPVKRADADFSAFAAVSILDNSSNGTYLNGQRLEKRRYYPVNSGDQIHLCSVGQSNVPRREWHWMVHLPYQNLTKPNQVFPSNLNSVTGNPGQDDVEFFLRYRHLCPLGAGSFADVWKVLDTRTNQHRAMKRIDKMKHPTGQREQNLRHFYQELDILRQVDHPNIVKYYDSYENARHIYIIQELCDGGEYLDYIMEAEGVEEDTARTITAMLTQAIAYLAEMGIAHRDLKPENILLSCRGEHPIPKIVDFGLAKRLVDPADQFSTQCGTPAYLAPEVVLERLRNGQGAYTTSVDMYSLGVITYAALANAMPYDAAVGVPIRQQCQDRNVDVEVLAGQFSPQALDFVKKLTQRHPQNRMTAKEALLHPWIRAWTRRHPSSWTETDCGLPSNRSSQESQPFGSSSLDVGNVIAAEGREVSIDQMSIGAATAMNSPSDGEQPTNQDGMGGPWTKDAGRCEREDTAHENGHENDSEERFSQEMDKMRLRSPTRGTTAPNSATDVAMESLAPPSRDGGYNMRPTASTFSTDSKKRIRQWSSSLSEIPDDENQDGGAGAATTPKAPPRPQSRLRSPRKDDGASGAGHRTPASRSGAVAPSKANTDSAPRRSTRLASVSGTTPSTSVRVAATRRRAAAVANEASPAPSTAKGSARPRKAPRKS